MGMLRQNSTLPKESISKKILMAYYIGQDLYSGCGRCPPLCPVGAISGSKSYHEIDPQTCNECIGFSEDPLCVMECSITDTIKSWKLDDFLQLF